jgi:hypothetical protein
MNERANPAETLSFGIDVAKSSMVGVKSKYLFVLGIRLDRLLAGKLQSESQDVNDAFSLFLKTFP